MVETKQQSRSFQIHVTCSTIDSPCLADTTPHHPGIDSAWDIWFEDHRHKVSVVIVTGMKQLPRTLSARRVIICQLPQFDQILDIPGRPMAPGVLPSCFLFEDRDFDEPLGSAGQLRADQFHEKVIDIAQIESGFVPAACGKQSRKPSAVKSRSICVDPFTSKLIGHAVANKVRGFPIGSQYMP